VFVDLLKNATSSWKNFGPGVLDRFGFTWEKIHAFQPEDCVMGSIKGFGSTAVLRLQGLRETWAQAMGGAMSTTACPTARLS